MKIHFSKKEYRLLLEAISISDWVLHSHTTSADQRSEAHGALYKKLRSYYKEMQCEDIIESVAVDDSYYERDVFMEEMLERYIYPYNGVTLFQELVDGLAKRDVVQENGPHALEHLSWQEYADIIEPKVDAYENEFIEHGISNIQVVRDNLADS